MTGLLERLQGALNGSARVPQQERRRLIRRECRYVVALRAGGRQLPAAVTDMSLGGMRVACKEKLAVGGLFQLVNPGEESGDVRCRVAWCRKTPNGYLAGLAYADTDAQLSRSWVKRTLQHLGFSDLLFRERRQDPRLFAHGVVEVHSAAGEFLGEGNLEDVSRRGIRFCTDCGLKPGTAVRVRIHAALGLPELRVAGVVRNWKPGRKKFSCGLELSEQPAGLERYLGKVRKQFYCN